MRAGNLLAKGWREFHRDLSGAPRRVYRTMRPLDFVIMAVGLLFCLVTMFYQDMTVTGPFSVILWDSLFDGKPLSFYGNCLASGIAPEGAVYDIGIYLVFAIWNLPIWILHRAVDISLTASGALLWYKILPALYTLACTSAVMDLAGSLGLAGAGQTKSFLKEKGSGGEGEAAEAGAGSVNALAYADYAGTFFLLCSMTVLPVFVTAQYDCIPLYFMLKGIQTWVRWNQEESREGGQDREFESGVSSSTASSLAGAEPVSMRSKTAKKEFLFWFALSLVTKPLGILVLFLLVILKEKNLFRIILQMLEGCSLLIVCKLVGSLSPDYRVSTGGFLEKHLPDLIQAEIPGGYGGISLFLLGLGVLYLAAYLYHPAKHTISVSNRMAIVLIYGIWAVFCAFGDMTPYWTIYLAPFLILAIFLTEEHRNELLLADLVGELCLAAVLILKFPWVYGGEKTFTYLLLKPFCGNILEGSRAVTIAGFLRQFHLDKLFTVINAVMAAWLLVTGVAAAKAILDSEKAGKSADGDQETVRIGNRNLSILHGHIRLRILLMLCWILLCLGAFYYMVK